MPVILVLTIPCAVVAACAGGAAARLVAVPVRWTYRAALLATTGCVVADVTLIAGALAERPAATASMALLLAIAASVARARLAGLAMNRMVRQRAAAR